MKSKILGLLAVGLLAGPIGGHADEILLNPGGSLTQFTTNANDAYDTGRGVWFRADQNLTVNGAGFYNGFGAGDAFSLTLWTANGTGSSLNIGSLGSFVVNPAAGDAFADGLFGSSISLTAGSYYALEVTSASLFDRNYFFCWSTTDGPCGAKVLGPVALAGGVTILDGYQSDNLGNFVAPYLRLKTVPEPGTLALLGLGLAGLGLSRRRKTH